MGSRVGCILGCLVLLMNLGCDEESTSSWLPVNDGLNISTISGLAVDKDDAKEIVFFTESEGWRTTDLGKKWTAISGGLPDPFRVSWTNMSGNVLSWCPGEPRTLYSPIQGGVFKSNDFGVTWQSIFNEPVAGGQPVDLSKYGLIAGVYCRPQDSSLFAGTVASGRKGGLFLLQNDTEPWQLIAGNGQGQGMGNDAHPIGSDIFQPHIMYAGAPHPADDGILDGFKRSEDGGHTWKQVIQLHNERIHTIWTDYSNPGYWLISGVKTYEMQPRPGMAGVNPWRELKDLPFTVNSFVLDDHKNAWAASLQGLYLREKTSGNWRLFEPFGVQELRNVAVRYVDGVRHIYVGTVTAGLLHMAGDGPIENITDSISTKPSIAWLHSIPGSSFIAAGVDGGGVFTLAKGEKTWQRLTRPIAHISEIVVFPDRSEAIVGNGDGFWHWHKSTNDLKLITDDGLQGTGSFMAWSPKKRDVLHVVTISYSGKVTREYTYYRLKKDAAGVFKVRLRRPLEANFVYDMVLGGKEDEYLVIAGENLLGAKIPLIEWDEKLADFQELFPEFQPLKKEAAIRFVEAEPATPCRVVFTSEAGSLYEGTIGETKPRYIPTIVSFNDKLWEMAAITPSVDWSKNARIYIVDKNAAFMKEFPRPSVVRWWSRKDQSWHDVEDGEVMKGVVDVVDIARLPWNDKQIMFGTMDRGVVVLGE